MREKKSIDRIEALIQEDVGRNVIPLFEATKGNLYAAAQEIAETKTPKIGIVTGFYVPAGNPPSAETDGPLGAVVLSAGLKKAAVSCRILTDSYCAGACFAAIKKTGHDIPLDVADTDDDLSNVEQLWKKEGITHILSIERCGQSADGKPRNMRGKDISEFTPAFDKLFHSKSWRTLAIGDGGNEIGMGAIDSAIIASCVAHGDKIACKTPADFLITAGVSNWGGYALLASLGVLRKEWGQGALSGLSSQTHAEILEAMVTQGPSVDGVTGEQVLSVDGFALERHEKKLVAVKNIASIHLR
ncbi:MAG: DUF4392 domain-containing protein [Alphaproteobacteria bacterium]|nr:DUF4392 domain-containing protein [Alphaproteobacteria bacterium]